MNQTRSMLFSDWDLEAIIMNITTNREDEFSHTVDLIQQGQFEEAESWLEVEISRYPWTLMAHAYVLMQNNKIEEAKKTLRAITLISQEALVQLWAWHNLRRLGTSPSPGLAQKILGIVIEVPFGESSDVLASYADGTARYLNHQGAIILWDTFDEVITPLIYEGIKLARPMGEYQQFHSDDPVADGEIRLTTLTPGGVYIWEGSPEDGSDISRLFAQQANLLRALVQMALKKKEDEGENEEP
jgi:hypothetical protein